jgi:hypothetical protein
MGQIIPQERRRSEDEKRMEFDHGNEELMISDAIWRTIPS